MQSLPSARSLLDSCLKGSRFLPRLRGPAPCPLAHLLSVFVLAFSIVGAGRARAAGRPKIDVIYLKNGDRITCEIKKLEHGQLQVKTPYTQGTVTINWEKVDRIESPQGFLVETESGRYYSGALRTDSKDGGNLAVISNQGETIVSQPKVVTVGQLERSFLGRLNGSIDYGFSFARANKQTQSTLHGDVEYRSEKRWIGATVDSLFSSQTSGTSTNRHSGTFFAFNRLRFSNWYAGVFAGLLKSDQQQLDLRTSLGGGLSRRFLWTNRNFLVGQMGIVYTNEKYAPDSADVTRFNNAEGALGLQYSTFRFDSTEFVSKLSFYPSITTPGRYRLNFDTSVYWDLVGDLYWRVGLYDTFDSRPPTATPRNDFGVSTSIGWSF